MAQSLTGRDDGKAAATHASAGADVQAVRRTANAVRARGRRWSELRGPTTCRSAAGPGARGSLWTRMPRRSRNRRMFLQHCAMGTPAGASGLLLPVESEPELGHSLNAIGSCLDGRTRAGDHRARSRFEPPVGTIGAQVLCPGGGAEQRQVADLGEYSVDLPPRARNRSRGCAAAAGAGGGSGRRESAASEGCSCFGKPRSRELPFSPRERRASAKAREATRQFGSKPIDRASCSLYCRKIVKSGLLPGLHLRPELHEWISRND